MKQPVRRPRAAALAAAPQPLEEIREEAERDYILSVLQLTKGDRARTARLLGISRKTLWKKMKHLGLRYGSDVTEG